MVLLYRAASADDKTDVRLGYWDYKEMEISMKEGKKEPLYLKLSPDEIKDLRDALDGWLKKLHAESVA